MTSVDGGSEAGGECSESGAWSDDQSSDAGCSEETESGDGVVKQWTAEEVARQKRQESGKERGQTTLLSGGKKNPEKQKAINDKHASQPRQPGPHPRERSCRQDPQLSRHISPRRHVAFLPACMSTSGRIHGELFRLIFFISNKQTGRRLF
jgi:hypothetical protein